MSAQEGLATLKIDRSRGRSRRLVWRLILLAALIAVISLAVTFAPKFAENYFGVEVSVAPVTFMETGKGELSAAGYVVADRVSVLAFKGTGLLKKLNVVESQTVSKNEIIGEIDHRDIDALIAQYKADLDEAKAEVKRLDAMAEFAAADAKRAHADILAAKAPLDTLDATVREMKIKLVDAQRRLDMMKNLAQNNATAATNVDDRVTEVQLAAAQIDTTARKKVELERAIEVAEAHAVTADAQAAAAKAAVVVAEQHVKAMASRIKVLDEQLVDAQVYSPFDGVVIEKAAEVGEIVAPISIGGSMARGSIATIAERKSLQAEVDVAEAYISKVKVGQRASIIIDAFPDKPLAGKVLRILPHANRGKATVQVRVEILAIMEHKEIIPDMDLRVKFLPDDAPAGAETNTAKKLAISKTALKGDEKDRYVWVVKDDVATKTTVVAGESKDESVEIVSGLTEGQKVVTKGADAIKVNNQKVRVAE
ncbi:MAG TPA: efflux RND transporter periplasmic adaptor subunit [Planctomycetota bacterium]|nr:efflux RND transporter periplasmic adaptor subunit [Planctomycetota bacterium]